MHLARASRALVAYQYIISHLIDHHLNLITITATLIASQYSLGIDIEIENKLSHTSGTVSGLTNVSLAVTTLRWQSHLRAPAASTSSSLAHQSK